MQAQEYNELTEAAIYSHPPSKQGASSDDDLDYDDDASWAAKKKPAKRKRQAFCSTVSCNSQCSSSQSECQNSCCVDRAF